MNTTSVLLRKHSLRATFQRVSVYESLAKKGHACAEDIYKEVRKANPLMSLATVYSILKLFARKGIVQEASFDRSKVYFDITVSLHHHFICTRCGKITDVDMPLCRTLKARQVQGNKIEGFTGIFYGICRDCFIKRKEKK